MPWAVHEQMPAGQVRKGDIMIVCFGGHDIEMKVVFAGGTAPHHLIYSKPWVLINGVNTDPMVPPGSAYVGAYFRRSTKLHVGRSETLEGETE